MPEGKVKWFNDAKGYDKTPVACRDRLWSLLFPD